MANSRQLGLTAKRASANSKMKNSPARMAATCLRSVLLENQISGSWAGDPIAGPRTLTLGVRLGRTSDLDKLLGLGEAVAMRAGLKHVRMSRYLSVVLAEFEMPRQAWHSVTLDHIQSRPGLLSMGLDTRGGTVSVDLAVPDTSQLLVAGMSGCGKTTLLRTMLYQLVREGKKRVYVIDSKSELVPFYGVAEAVHTTKAGATAHLQEIAGDLQGYRDSVIAVDEIAALIYENAKAATALGLITSQGRSLGINLLAGTQKVTKQVLGNEMIIANTARIVGRVANANDSVLASGHAGMNAHQLSGYGDFLFMQGADAQRFIAAQADDYLGTLPPAPAELEQANEVAALPSAHAEYYDVGILVAASVGRELSAAVVKEILGGCGTDKARRLRDEALTVIRGITDGGAMVSNG